MRCAGQTNLFVFRPCLVSLVCLVLASLSSFTSLGQEVDTSARGVMELYLKDSAQVASNLVRLSDLIEANHCRGINSRQLDLILAPSPPPQSEQEWTRSSITSLLALKGMSISSIQWDGSVACQVRRSQRVSASATSSSVNASTNASVAAASAISSSKHVFEPASAASKNQSAAERNAIAVIQPYLRTKSDCDFDYEIALDIPPEGVTFLKNRGDIIGISGGQSPWLGSQRFALQIKDGTDLTVVEVGARVEMPPRVFATVRSLPRDHVITDDDLRLVILPKTSRVELSMCFTSSEELIGKQLNRALATGQPIESGHVGNPRLVSQNDEIEIQVATPGLMVSSPARALQGGGMNDLIMIEVLPKRSKLMARVIGAGVVSAISN